MNIGEKCSVLKARNGRRRGSAGRVWRRRLSACSQQSVSDVGAIPRKLEARYFFLPRFTGNIRLMFVAPMPVA
jgi:hypothetical protein